MDRVLLRTGVSSPIGLGRGRGRGGGAGSSSLRSAPLAQEMQETRQQAIVWTRALADAWRRVRSNAGALQYFFLRSPHTYALYSGGPGGGGGAAPSSSCAPTLSAFVCSVAHRTALATAKKSKAAIGVSPTPVPAPQEPLCVLSGVNSALLLRLQELGAAPRVATAPGAVLPGVYVSAGAEAEAEIEARAEAGAEAGAGAGAGASGAVSSGTRAGGGKVLSMVQQQQQAKEAADAANRMQNEALAAVAAHGHTALVVGVAEIGIVIDVMCEAMLAAVTSVEASGLHDGARSADSCNILTTSNKPAPPSAVPHSCRGATHRSSRALPAFRT